MKKLAACAAVLGLLLTAAPPARAGYEPGTDYAAQMALAAEAGDAEAGREAQLARDEKLAALGLDLPSVDYDELSLLARLIWAEAGSAWLDETWKMAVGEVALNRVASPEFPDTLLEVVTQPGQYYGPTGAYLDYVKPDRASVQAAMRLLSGERVLNDPAVVFQANIVLGSGVALELRDPRLGSTYLCYTSRPELYP